MNWIFGKKPKASTSDKKGNKALKASSSSDKNSDKDKPLRGNYLCGRCNMPKKGHKCPFDVAYRPAVPTQKYDAWVQVELGNQVVSSLGDLTKQGTYESYIITDQTQLPHVSVGVEVAEVGLGLGPLEVMPDVINTNADESLDSPRISGISIDGL